MQQFTLRCQSLAYQRRSRRFQSNQKHRWKVLARKRERVRAGTNLPQSPQWPVPMGTAFTFSGAQLLVHRPTIDASDCQRSDLPFVSGRGEFASERSRL